MAGDKSLIDWRWSCEMDGEGVIEFSQTRFQTGECRCQSRAGLLDRAFTHGCKS